MEKLNGCVLVIVRSAAGADTTGVVMVEMLSDDVASLPWNVAVLERLVPGAAVTLIGIVNVEILPGSIWALFVQSIVDGGLSTHAHVLAPPLGIALASPTRAVPAGSTS